MGKGAYPLIKQPTISLTTPARAPITGETRTPHKIIGTFERLILISIMLDAGIRASILSSIIERAAIIALAVSARMPEKFFFDIKIPPCMLLSHTGGKNICFRMSASGMRKPDRKTQVFSSDRQLPVPSALDATRFSTLTLTFSLLKRKLCKEKRFRDYIRKAI